MPKAKPSREKQAPTSQSQIHDWAAQLTKPALGGMRRQQAVATTNEYQPTYTIGKAAPAVTYTASMVNTGADSG